MILFRKKATRLNLEFLSQDLESICFGPEILTVIATNLISRAKI